MAESGISLVRARQHEKLALALDALLAELRPQAARHPDGAVSEPLRIAAETLLFEAGRFRPRRRRDRFPAAAPTLGALAVELGQARAGLEAFELVHSFWSPRHKAFLWRVGGDPVPVARLRARADIEDRLATRADRRRHHEIRAMFTQRIERAYDEGYEHGSSGHPHTGSIPRRS